eukprot:SAG11_NODE_16598_length_543_cov_0.887387_1_plen_108_part_10
MFVPSGSNTRRGGFSTSHNEPVISGSDIGGNLTIFLGQASRHEGGILNDHDNERGKLNTASVSCSKADNDYPTSIGKSIRSSSRHSSSLLIVCPPMSRLPTYVACVIT